MIKTYTVGIAYAQVEAFSPEHAAEKLLNEIEAGNHLVFDVNHETDNFEIDMNSLPYLEKKLKDLDDNIYSLECSDERLFTNANGNKARYDNMCAERKEIASKIDELKNA